MELVEIDDHRERIAPFPSTSIEKSGGGDGSWIARKRIFDRFLFIGHSFGQFVPISCVVSAPSPFYSINTQYDTQTSQTSVVRFNKFAARVFAGKQTCPELSRCRLAAGHYEQHLPHRACALLLDDLTAHNAFLPARPSPPFRSGFNDSRGTSVKKKIRNISERRLIAGDIDTIYFIRTHGEYGQLRECSNTG